MVDTGRRRFLIGDHYRHAFRRDVKEQARKLARQMDTAVGFRIAGYATCMQGHPVLGELLCIGHRRVVVQARMVVCIFQEGMKHAGRRLVPPLAAADGTCTDLHAVTVRIGALLIEADQRPGSGLPAPVAVPR